MFWFFLAVFWACETYLHAQGYDTFLYTHKTPAEKRIRARKLGIDKDKTCDS